MALEPKDRSEIKASSQEPEEAPRKRAPTLYAIIVFKLVKGALFVALAIAAYCLSDDDLPRQYGSLLHFLHVQPETRFWAALGVKIGQLTEVKLLWAAAATLIYSLFALVEGVGLMFRVSWAGWMAIGESAFFIPLEVDKLVKSFTWLVLVILITNVVIVWYLFNNRHRLFRHHHHS